MKWSQLLTICEGEWILTSCRALIYPSTSFLEISLTSTPALMASCTSNVQNICEVHTTTCPGHSFTHWFRGAPAYACRDNNSRNETLRIFIWGRGAGLLLLFYSKKKKDNFLRRIFIVRCMSAQRKNWCIFVLCRGNSSLLDLGICQTVLCFDFKLAKSRSKLWHRWSSSNSVARFCALQIFMAMSSYFIHRYDTVLHQAPWIIVDNNSLNALFFSNIFFILI